LPLKKKNITGVFFLRPNNGSGIFQGMSVQVAFHWNS